MEMRENLPHGSGKFGKKRDLEGWELQLSSPSQSCPVADRQAGGELYSSLIHCLVQQFINASLGTGSCQPLADFT